MKRIVDIVSLLTAIALLMACSTESDFMGSGHFHSTDGVEKVDVHLMLSVGGGAAPSTTRALSTISPTADEGEFYERRITDAQILVYDATTENFLEHATITNGLSTSDDGTTYTLTGTLYDIPKLADYTSKDYLFVVLCNIEGEGTVPYNDTQVKGLYTAYYTDGKGGTTNNGATAEFIPDIHASNPNIVGTLNKLIQNLTFRGYNAGFSARLVASGNEAEADNTTRIPMWGITKLTSTKLQTLITKTEEEQKESPVAVNVLRAMAKVRVTLSDDLLEAGYRLTHINAGTYSGVNNHLPTAGYLAAQTNAVTSDGETNWNHAGNHSSNPSTGITVPSVANLPLATGWYSGTSFTGNITDDWEITDDNQSQVMYIPEHQNVTTSDQTATPAFIYLGGLINIGETNNWENYVKINGDSPILHFADYTGKTSRDVSASTWDIIRNDFYDFTIKSINEDGLQANVRVMPWDYKKMEYELGDDVKIYLTDATYKAYQYGSTEEFSGIPTVYGADGKSMSQLSVYLRNPKGVTWRAHLTNYNNFKIVIEEATGHNNHGLGLGSTNSGGTAYSDATLPTDAELTKVSVVPLNPYASYDAGEMPTTQLYFTVETLGSTVIPISCPASGFNDLANAMNADKTTLRFVQLNEEIYNSSNTEFVSDYRR